MGRHMYNDYWINENRRLDRALIRIARLWRRDRRVRKRDMMVCCFLVAVPVAVPAGIFLTIPDIPWSTLLAAAIVVPVWAGSFLLGCGSPGVPPNARIPGFTRLAAIPAFWGPGWALLVALPLYLFILVAWIVIWGWFVLPYRLGQAYGKTRTAHGRSNAPLGQSRSR